MPASVSAPRARCRRREPEPEVGVGGGREAWCANFAAVPHADFRLGMPSAGEWHEVVNTDAGTYSGSGVGNLGAVTAHEGGERASPPTRPWCCPSATLWLRRD